MHMPGAAADAAILTPEQAAVLAWQNLAPQRWPLPLEAFPPEAALVGGAVRDALLNRLGPSPDLDLVVAGDAISLCRQLGRRHGGSVVVLDADRSIARLVIAGWSIDLARMEGSDLHTDLQRRDYTVNAMALPLAAPDKLDDPLGGLAHLQQNVMVAVCEQNLLDDPLRLLRGLRLSSELGFGLSSASEHWIRQHHQSLAQVASERVLAEIEKLVAAVDGEQGLITCLQLGLLDPWRADNTVDAVEQLERCSTERSKQLGLTAEEQQQALPLARLAACLDGTGLRKLHSSRRLQQRVERLRHWQRQLGRNSNLSPEQAENLAEADRLRLQRDLEEDLPALLLNWPLKSAAPWLARWRDPDDLLFHPKAAINGVTLQEALGLKASPKLGKLLEHLMLEQAFGRVHNKEETLLAAQTWLESAH
jgi:tRNA nucleotidyltransferase (CCA-adding enzyme)